MIPDNFHPFLGPVLMISYALLSNTLLLTVLVAILGNTFATINADAAAEVSRDRGISYVTRSAESRQSMFRKAVSTIEGVKADAVFSYQLPFNLLMVVTLWPMSYVLSPRWFHKVNGKSLQHVRHPVKRPPDIVFSFHDSPVKLASSAHHRSLRKAEVPRDKPDGAAGGLCRTLYRQPTSQTARSRWVSVVLSNVLAGGV